MCKGICLTALTFTVIGLVGCAQQSQPTSYHTSTYQQPTRFGSLPERSRESQDPKTVAGYPEGHPLAGTGVPEKHDISSHTSNTEAQFELD